VLESVLFFTCGVLTMERHASIVKSVSQKHKGKEKTYAQLLKEKKYRKNANNQEKERL
jgi:hypothetical protein